MATATGNRPAAGRSARLALLAVPLLAVLPSTDGNAERVSDVRGTKHNLSVAASSSIYTRAKPAGSPIGTVPSRSMKATAETQVCVFCHTPHQATAGITPLWNRKVAGTGYTQSYVLYDSSTLDAKQVQSSLDQPGGSSKLCLSCHDGTVAVGNVNLLNGVDTSGSAQNVDTVGMTGTFVPVGAGTGTGFTRNLGTTLENDHPISVTYNSALAARDGELRVPDGSLVGERSSGVRPTLPLEPTGASNEAQIQCAACHDPHLLETSSAVGNQKFLRLNRFQGVTPPSSSGFDSNTATGLTGAQSGDIICLACHDKGGASWAFSAHANDLVANETYGDTHATRREFPLGLKVWQAACLNCHDTHTVQGARRLLREGTNEGIGTAASPKPGGAGTAALEETCYQCHDGGTNGTLQSASEVPDIKSDFTLSARRMPITTVAQGTSGGSGGNATEPHDISANFDDPGFIDCSTAGTQCGKDFIEPRAKLGVGDLQARHVECTDCHNPHRVIRAESGLPGALTAANTSTARVNGASGGHHAHTNTDFLHTNAISGVLRGAWGVEPIYSSDKSFQLMPTGFEVKRGDPGTNTSTAASQSYVTREYQICLKCHSNYGYDDDNAYSSTTRPELGGSNLSSSTRYTRYTNQAKEFQAPAAHQGELSTTDSGASSTYSTNNHRGWHPVMGATGRTTAVRGGMTSSSFNLPWRNVGTQTMYCSDCHGSVTATATAIPSGTSPWGPHGSANDFILKGTWNTSTGSGQESTGLCFKCHNYATYATKDGSGRTGFFNDPSDKGRGDLHKYHADKIGKMRCNWCHTAVPHGWKNKQLLVNLNDVGPEAGLVADTQVRNNTTALYTRGPYYREAILKVKRFAPSGSWLESDCGSKGAPGNNKAGRDWMRDSNENCASPP